MLFDYIINKVRNTKTFIPVINNNNNVDIEITKDGIFTKVDIKKDCNLAEYVCSVDKLGIKEIDKKIANKTLLDNGVKLIKSKTIYIFSYNNKNYNLYLDNNIIFIDERIIDQNNEENYITEKTVEIDLTNMQYKISTMNHDKHLSTHNIKFYDSRNNESSYFSINKIDALKIMNIILTDLSKVPNINNIINLEFALSNFNLNEEKQTKIL